MNFNLLETVVTNSSSLPSTITTFHTSFASPVPFWNGRNNTSAQQCCSNQQEILNKHKFSGTLFLNVTTEWPLHVYLKVCSTHMYYFNTDVQNNKLFNYMRLILHIIARRTETFLSIHVRFLQRRNKGSASETTGTS